MPFLAIDTSNHALSIAIGDQQKPFGEATTFIDRNHSNHLMPLIDQLMSRLEIQPDELTGIIVGKGPGSYTGVRIGVTAAKTLAWSLNIPLVAVSSLLTMAHTARMQVGITCPLIDARRRQVYGCAYGWHKEQMLLPEAIWQLDTLMHALEEMDQPMMFVGSGAVLYQEEIRARLENKNRPIWFGSSLSTGYSRAVHLLELGIERYLTGDVEDPYMLLPAYLQPTEAEAKLLKADVEGNV